MLLSSFVLDIFYAQIAVFHSDLSNPFNDWTDEHIHQGFAWRPGSVSFGMLNDYGEAIIEIRLGQKVDLLPTTVRAIEVPFLVSETNLIEVASITDSQKLAIPGGNYSLVFATGFDENKRMWCHFTFRPGLITTAHILQADAGIKCSGNLLMIAKPA